MALTRSSLSADTKDALARDVPPAAHCRLALRAGLAYFAGADVAGRRVVRTRRASIARLVRSLGGEREGNVRRTVEPRLYRSTMFEIDFDAVFRFGATLRKPRHLEIFIQPHARAPTQ